MNLVEQTPEAFANLDLVRAARLPMAEKLRVFYSLVYPASTWWYHRVLGVGREQDLEVVDRLAFLKHLCENDLYYFAKFILRKSKLREYPNRGQAERLMSRHWPDRQERKLMLEPRETYKTTLASVAWPVWLLTRDRDTSVLIYSETDKQAKEIYLTCKEELEINETLRTIWGAFRSDRWNETHLFVKGRKNTRRDPSLTHAGVDSSLNGVHPDVAVLDDLCSEENTQSIEQRDKTWDKYRLLTPLVQKRGLIQVVGTRWCKDDLYDRIAQAERDIYSEFSVHSAEDVRPDGRLYGEDIGLSRSILEQKRKSFGTYRYSANYLNNPVPDADQALKPEWLNFYTEAMPSVTDATGEVRPLPLRIFMTIDASWADQESRSGKDPTAMIVFGVDPRGNVWNLEHFNRRVTPDEVVKECFRLVRKWRPEAVASEHVGTQKGINSFLEREMETTKEHFRLVYVKHQHTSKRSRIMGMSPRFEARTIYIRPEMRDFVDQYTTFSPHYDLGHDDLLDALEMGVSEFAIETPPDEDETEFQQQYYDTFADFDPVTGRV